MNLLLPAFVGVWWGGVEMEGSSLLWAVPVIQYACF